MKKIVNWFKSLKSSKDEATESEIDDKKKFEGTDRAFGATHPGMRRPNNEDAFKIHLNEIFIVADGMGGHNAGEVASSKAVEYLTEFFTQELISQMKNNPSLIPDKLREAIEKTHQRLYELSKTNPEYEGMGTTVVLAFINQNTLYTCHTGDSRVYVIDKNSINQITNDHSLVWDLYKQGKISKEEARLSTLKNRITQAVGYSIKEPELNRYELKDEDLILLCSDGLWDMLSDEEIFSIVSQGGTLEEIVRRLIDRANEAGGDDNITVILIRHKIN